MFKSTGLCLSIALIATFYIFQCQLDISSLSITQNHMSVTLVPRHIYYISSPSAPTPIPFWYSSNSTIYILSWQICFCVAILSLDLWNLYLFIHSPSYALLKKINSPFRAFSSTQISSTLTLKPCAIVRIHFYHEYVTETHIFQHPCPHLFENFSYSIQQCLSASIKHIEHRRFSCAVFNNR